MGFIILTVFLIYHFTYPKWLDKQSRNPTTYIETALVILLAYYLILPTAQFMLFKWFFPNITNENMTMKHHAIGFWIGHLVALPIIVLWIWDRVKQEFFSDKTTSSGIIIITSTKANNGNNKPPRTALVSIGMAFVFLLITWPVIIFCTTSIGIAKQYFTDKPLNPIAHKTLELLQSQPEMNRWFFLIILAVVIGAPIVEEIVYRGTIQALIRSSTVSPWTSILGTATFFSLIHYRVAAPEALPGLLILGIGLGIAYDYTGRIITPIVMHLLFNLANIVMALG